MMTADLLHANVQGLVLSGVPSPCRRACSANAFARHFALRIAVQPAVFSDGSSRLHGPCRRAWHACAFARHAAQRPALHSMQPSHVQMSCLEHGRPVAVAVFAGALAARAAAPPGRRCRTAHRGLAAAGFAGLLEHLGNEALAPVIRGAGTDAEIVVAAVGHGCAPCKLWRVLS